MPSWRNKMTKVLGLDLERSIPISCVQIPLYDRDLVSREDLKMDGPITATKYIKEQCPCRGSNVKPPAYVYTDTYNMTNKVSCEVK